MCDLVEAAAIVRAIIPTEEHQRRFYPPEGFCRNLGSDLGRAHGDLVTDRRKAYEHVRDRAGLTRDPEHHLRALHGKRRQAEIHRLPIPRHRALVKV